MLLGIIDLSLADENMPVNTFKNFHFLKQVSCKIVWIIADY